MQLSVLGCRKRDKWCVEEARGDGLVLGGGERGNWGEEGGMISRLPNSYVGQEADYRFLIGSRINAKVDHPSLRAWGWRRKRNREST